MGSHSTFSLVLSAKHDCNFFAPYRKYRLHLLPNMVWSKYRAGTRMVSAKKIFSYTQRAAPYD